VVKEKHRETRRQRRNDVKKLSYLEISGTCRKQRKVAKTYGTREIVEGPKTDNYTDYIEKKDLASSDVNLSSAELHGKSLLTFYALKLNLYEAHDAAVNVFKVTLKGKAQRATPLSEP